MRLIILYENMGISNVTHSFVNVSKFTKSFPIEEFISKFI